MTKLQEHEDSTSNCFAVRRVNPFLGVLQVIQNQGGRAVSANGVVWDIEVLAETEAGYSRQPAYYRYGLWSREDGLVSRPLSPHLENDPLTHQCHSLISEIETKSSSLPFELVDHRELWLFDQQEQLPLALLASACDNDVLPSPEPKYWSACIGAQGVPSQRRYPQAKQLEEQVRIRAGFNIRAYWITRNSDGSGQLESSGVSLPAKQFPAYLLTEEWIEPDQQKLASDFIEWISPSLLTLQHLDTKQRLRIEKNLSRQAVSVEHHWHLYPEVIEQKYLQAARVQCRIQQACQNK